MFMEAEIRIKEWFDSDTSPVNIGQSAVGQSMEEYWANMTLSYADMEAGSLDDYDDGDDDDDEDDQEEEDDEDEDNDEDFQDDEDMALPHDSIHMKLNGLFHLETGVSDDEVESDEDDNYESSGMNDENDDENSDPDAHSDFDNEMLWQYMAAPAQTPSSAKEVGYDNEYYSDVADQDGDMGIAEGLLGIEQDSDSSETGSGQYGTEKVPGQTTHSQSAPKKKLVAEKKGNCAKRERAMQRAPGKKKPSKLSRAPREAEMKHKVVNVVFSLCRDCHNRHGWLWYVV